MKFNRSILIFLLIIGFGIHSFAQNRYIDIVKLYIKYYNTGDISGIDSILTSDCKSFSKKVVLDKYEMTDIIKNLSKNEYIEIKEINSGHNSVKTKEFLTDDIINYLGLQPIIRKREYNFDHNYKIKSIFNLDVSFPENFEEKQDKFLDWANIRYPELYNNMTENYRRGDNIAEERRFLLTLLKEEGLESLDSLKKKEKNKEIKIVKEEIIEAYHEDRISFDKFRIKTLLKTKEEIEIIFGTACDSKDISNKLFWYYGSGICNDDYNGPNIFYKDNGEEIQQVQIEFNDAGIAVSVNAI